MEIKRRYSITLDDDSTVHKIVAKITGVPSLPFSNRDKLIESASRYDPWAFFCDVHLRPPSNGLDVIPILKKIWDTVPIIVLTADTSSNLVGKALAAGANDFVTKPINSDELVGRLLARLTEAKSRPILTTFSVGDVRFSYFSRSIQKSSKVAYLGHIEVNIFHILAQNYGIPLSKDILKSDLWGTIEVSNNTLDKGLSRIRGLLRNVDSELVVKSEYRGGVFLQFKNEQRSA